jgi:hypothetical protein
MTRLIGNLSSDSSEQLASDCQGVGVEVSAGQSGGPIPNDPWEAVWKSALTEVQDGYFDCIGGVQGNNTAQANQGVTEMRSAVPLLTALANEFGGS